MSTRLNELHQLEMKCLALASAAMDHVNEIRIMIEAEEHNQAIVATSNPRIADALETIVNSMNIVDPTFEENWDIDQQRLDAQHRLDNPILALRTEEPS